MDCTTYEPIVELNAFPEVAPPPLRGTFWILGKSYNLPQRKLLLILLFIKINSVVVAGVKMVACFVGDPCNTVG